MDRHLSMEGFGCGDQNGGDIFPFKQFSIGFGVAAEDSGRRREQSGGAGGGGGIEIAKGGDSNVWDVKKGANQAGAAVSRADDAELERRLVAGGGQDSGGEAGEYIPPVWKDRRRKSVFCEAESEHRAKDGWWLEYGRTQRLNPQGRNKSESTGYGINPIKFPLHLHRTTCDHQLVV